MKLQAMFYGAAMLLSSSLCFATHDKAAEAKSADKAPSADVSDDTLKDQEKAVWQAYKDKDADAFKKFFASDYQGVYAGGINGAKGEVDDLKNGDLKSFDLDNVKVSHPTKTSALLTYKVDLKGTMGKDDISGSYYTSSLWAKRGGKWLAILHTQAKSEK